MNSPSEQNETQKEIEIIVNGRKRTATGKEISFESVVKLAFDNAFQNPNTIYTVTFKRGEDKKPEGSMVEGDTVKLKTGMVFNVTATDKS